MRTRRTRIATPGRNYRFYGLQFSQQQRKKTTPNHKSGENGEIILSERRRRRTTCVRAGRPLLQHHHRRPSLSVRQRPVSVHHRDDDLLVYYSQSHAHLFAATPKFAYGRARFGRRSAFSQIGVIVVVCSRISQLLPSPETH